MKIEQIMNPNKHDITEYHKFVKISDMTDEFLKTQSAKPVSKEILQKELNVDQSVLNQFTYPVYEEEPDEEAFNNFENHPELLTIKRVKGKAQIMTVRSFFALVHKDSPEVMKDIDKVLQETIRAKTLLERAKILEEELFKNNEDKEK